MLLVFIPRELFAYVANRPSPLSEHPASVLIVVAAFFVIETCPHDFIYRFLDGLYAVLGLAQGLNQTRFLTRMLEKFTKVNPVLQIVVVFSFLILDQVIEIIARRLMKGEETKMSNFTTIFRTVVFSLVFWISTQKNFLTPYVGKYSMEIPALILALVLGIANATAILNPEYEPLSVNVNKYTNRRSQTPVDESAPATPRRNKKKQC